MSIPVILLLALLLDAWLGEPKWLWSRLPHPAVLMGRVIGWADATFNTGPSRRAKGVALTIALVAGALAIGRALSALPDGGALTCLVAAILLAHRSLIDHVSDVASALRTSLPEARQNVAMIVGRDTADLDAAGVSRAAIESAAENFSDGVVAPAFWFLIAGLPGLIAYKAVNTADSMIGYLTPRHREFGWAAARLDDLLNWIPARLTAFLIALMRGQLRHWPAICADARLHNSPNAGWPEAAMARALDVALAGPRSYHGEVTAFAWVHESGRKTIGAAAIEHAITALWRVWWAGLTLIVVIDLIL